jgi:hypothetical protein
MGQETVCLKVCHPFLRSSYAHGSYYRDARMTSMFTVHESRSIFDCGMNDCDVSSAPTASNDANAHERSGFGAP